MEKNVSLKSLSGNHTSNIEKLSLRGIRSIVQVNK